MKVLINYANDRFSEAQKLNSISGKQIGLFDKVFSYSPKDIETEFFEHNRHILNQTRGNGYWLWKPYFIKKTLDILDFGDFLFYSDSGSYFIRSIEPLIDISLERGQDIIVFDNKLLERVWTKRDAFLLMDCDSAKYSDSTQRKAAFSLWKKSSFTINFIEEFLSYAQDERIITDLPNQCGVPNYPDFKEHRHDQSIFSLLTKKYDLEAYRDPSQWGNSWMESFTSSNYEQLLEHRRLESVPYYVKSNHLPILWNNKKD